ncbi:MAG: hypothetical protein AABX29_10125 [Nanoarchaeota archaeon]
MPPKFYLNSDHRCAQTTIKCVLGNNNLSWKYLDRVMGVDKDQIISPIQIAFCLQRIGVDFIYPVKALFLEDDFNLIKTETRIFFGDENYQKTNFDFIKSARLELIRSGKYLECDGIDMKKIKLFIDNGRIPICLINYDIYINREDKKRGHYLIILNTLDDIVDVMDTGPSDASPNKRISIKRLERSLVHTPIDYGIIFV